MASNSKPAAELRIGTVKATVWENEVGGITRHNVTFSRIYPDGGQWKTAQSFGFSNLLSVAKLADQAHTLIAKRKAEAASAAGDDEAAENDRTFRRRVHPRRPFFWMPVLPRRRIELLAPVGEGRFGGYSNFGPDRERPA